MLLTSWLSRLPIKGAINHIWHLWANCFCWCEIQNPVLATKRTNCCSPVQKLNSVHTLYWPTAVVVATHEHFPASTADGAVGLVAVVVVLVGTLQERVLHRMRRQRGRGCPSSVSLVCFSCVCAGGFCVMIWFTGEMQLPQISVSLTWCLTYSSS